MSRRGKRRTSSVILPGLVLFLLAVLAFCWYAFTVISVPQRTGSEKEKPSPASRPAAAPSLARSSSPDRPAEAYTHQCRTLTFRIQDFFRKIGIQARNVRVLNQLPRSEGGKQWLYTEASVIVPAGLSPREVAGRLAGELYDVPALSSEWVEQTGRSGRLVIRLHGLLTHSCTIESRLFSLAIIIDDVGGNLALTRQFLSAGVPLTLAVLPDLSSSRESEQLAHAAGYEVMLHLPMEPGDIASANPGALAIYHDMGKAEVQGIIAHHLKSFTHIDGVNNHMGSRITQDEQILAWVMEAIRPRGLYFVDSRTSSQSAAYGVAQQMGVPAGKNTVFLDNDHDVASCRTYLEQAIGTVKKKGSAIAIGHCRSTTLQAIREMEPRFREEQIALVFVSDVVQ